MTVTYALTALLVVLMLAGGGLLTDIGEWYRLLRKPPWNPPNWLFAPAWTTILCLAGWSGAIAWTKAEHLGARPLLAVVAGLVIFFHLLWSPLFFKLKRPDLSLIEIPFLWLSVLAAVIAVARISLPAAALLLPYLVWVAFATVLNLAIVRLNAPFAQARPPTTAPHT